MSLDPLALIASLVTGASLALLAWWIVQAAQYQETEQGHQWQYDVTRVNQLRKLDFTYRLFSGLMPLMSRLNRAALGPRLAHTGRLLQAAGLPRFWLPEEYWARNELIAAMLLPLYVVVCVQFMGPAGIVSAFLLAGLTVWLLQRRLAQRAEQRLLDIKRRMPYFLDLLTLLMEAGSSFLHALRQAVHEFENHPVAVEFGRVLGDMNMGKSRHEAFDNMRQRLNDDEVASIIGSMVQSEELGTPLSHILRTQAEVLRVKRSQRAETVAAEAGVNMLLPGVLVMAATMLVILGPFLLNYLLFGMTF